MDDFSDSIERVGINVKIPVDLHRLLKIAAINQRQTIQDLVTAILEKEFKNGQ